MTVTDGEIFRHCLLTVLTWSGDGEGWTPLVRAMEEAEQLAVTKYDRKLEVGYPAKKRAKNALVREGRIAQKQAGRHFVVRLLGDPEEVLSQQLFDADQADDRPPDPPFRVGRGHMMPFATWRATVEAVREGRCDVIVVRRETKSKIDYWDER